MSTINIDSKFFNHDAQAGGFFPETHIDPGFTINKFITETGKNFLIEGIRGSGKTHILKMINQLCLEKYEENRILPIYLSLANVGEYISNDINRFRLHFYANIVLSAVKTLEKNKKYFKLSKDFSGALNALKKLFGLTKESNINELLEKIYVIHKSLLNKLTHNMQKYTKKVSMIKKAKKGMKMGVPELNIGMDLGYRTTNTNEENFEYLGETLSHLNASQFIIEFFYQIKNILGIKYSLILLDECSDVPSEAQVEVFRLLKLIRASFGDDSQINTAYFCATVYPGPKTYYPSRKFGDPFDFEIGNDATMEYLYLDELSEEYLPFYNKLTKRRIALISNKRYSEVDILDIFDKQETFILAAYFSNGVVRRYFEILKFAYDNLRRRINNDSSEIIKISKTDIEIGVNSIVSTQLLSSNRINEKDYQIFNKVMSQISRRNKKNETENRKREDTCKVPSNLYFIISRSDYELVGTLISQGVFHDKEKSQLRKCYKKSGSREYLLLLDLAVAYSEEVIKNIRAYEIFTKDIITNAKNNFKWCQNINFKELNQKI